MKIKSYAGGGIAYLPTTNRTGDAAAQAASSSNSSNSSKVPGFAAQILDLVKSEGIDSDVDAFLRRVERTLDLANDPTGENLSMRDILSIAREASLVKTNNKMYTEAQKNLDSEDAWGDVATDRRGNIYAMNNETKSIEKINPSNYDREKYTALTNHDLMSFRWSDRSVAYNTDLITDVSGTIGIKTLTDYLVGLVKNFADTSVTGYAGKQGDNIASGMKAIVNHADTNGNTLGDLITTGPDGIYKLSQKSTIKDTHIQEAVNYLIEALPSDMRHALVAKATVEGYDPNAFLVELLDAHTGRTISADYDQTTSNAAGYGGGSESGGPLIQQTLAETYVTGSNAAPMLWIPIAPNGSSTTLLASGTNVGTVRLDRSGNPGQPMPTCNLRTLIQDSYAIGSVTNRGTVVFGDQLVDSSQLDGIVYTGTDMYRVVLPSKVVNGKDIVPDFELQEQLDAIIQNAENQGADAATINRYLQQKCPGARYNPTTKSIELPEDRKHVFLTFGAQASSKYIDFEKNSKYLTEVTNPNKGVYNSAVEYGYATHKKNDPKSAEASGMVHSLFPAMRTGKLYEGMVYLPVTNDLAGSTQYNQGYAPKESYTNVTGRYAEHERELAIQDRMSSGEIQTNW